MWSEQADIRDEWYGFNRPYINVPPRWYWIGLVASAIWLFSYLLIYPSIPVPGGHWHGVGVPGGCRPWTAICEMETDLAQLDSVRGGYIHKIRETSLSALAQDRDLREFVMRAGRVPYAERCAACHGMTVSGQLRLGDVSGIYAGITQPERHPFGMAAHLDEATAKILTLYVWNQR